MGKIKNIAESSVIGIFSTILASYLLENLNYIFLFLIFLIITIMVSAVIFIYRRYPKYFGKKGSFAVTALIFNGENKFLLIFHRRQKKWIPPGKHLKDSLKPHEEILKAVKEETGYIATFHSHHNPAKPKKIDRFSIEVPQPFYILEETQLSKEGHNYHYDLFYICEVKDDDGQGVSRGSLQKEWVSLDKLEKLVQEDKTYPDVYRVALKAFGEISP